MRTDGTVPRDRNPDGTLNVGVLQKPGWTLFPSWRCGFVQTEGGPFQLCQCVNRKVPGAATCAGPHVFRPRFTPVRVEK